MEDEIVTLRQMAASCLASPEIAGEAGEKHAMALAAIAPIFLGVSRGFWIGVVEGQFKVEPLCEVAAAAGANSLLGKSVEEQAIAFVAKAPILLTDVAPGRNGVGERSSRTCNRCEYGQYQET